MFLHLDQICRLNSWRIVKNFTGDGIWCFRLDSETNVTEWNGVIWMLPYRINPITESPLKTVLFVLLDAAIIIHQEFVPERTILNCLYYLGYIKRWYLCMRRVRNEKLWYIWWLLVYKMSSAHCAFNVKYLVTFIYIYVINYLPWSPFWQGQSFLFTESWNWP